MSSMSGYITYINYTAGTNKGGVKIQDKFNSPFAIGEMNDERMNYTSERVVEPIAADGTKTFTLAWQPVDLTLAADGTTYANIIVRKADGTVMEQDTDYTVDVTTPVVKNQDNTVMNTVTRSHNKEIVKITFTAAPTEADGIRVAYKYMNEVIPQHDLPILNAELKTIPLFAHARRIAIYYSQIAAFQAKTDYGFDLGDQLAEQAVAELKYEIDGEVVKMLDDGAEADATLAWSKTLPVGVNKAD